MQEKSKSIGLTYALVAAFALVVFSVLMYIGGIKVYMSSAAFLGYIFLVVLAVLGAIKQKKLNGGFLDFRQALKITFTVFVFALAVQTIFNYFLLNYIDTNFKTVLAQATLEKTEVLMRKFGASDEMIEKAMDNARAHDPFTFSRMLLGYAFWCIVMFIFSLIISAIVKKQKPEFDNLPS
jgi:hypothetical protein